jgi:hypothetical protein
MEAARSTETSVNLYQIKVPHVPDDNRHTFHSRRRENLQSSTTLISSLCLWYENSTFWLQV